MTESVQSNRAVPAKNVVWMSTVSKEPEALDCCLAKMTISVDIAFLSRKPYKNKDWRLDVHRSSDGDGALFVIVIVVIAGWLLWCCRIVCVGEEKYAAPTVVDA